MAWVSITQHHLPGLKKEKTRISPQLQSKFDLLFSFLIQVLDVPPIQCYAFTQGHVISVADSLDKVDQAGRHLLYSNRQQSFEVKGKRAKGYGFAHLFNRNFSFSF